jgi:glucosamine--fructose-6-phosphate aminotransferase (isomerizing)
MKGQHTYQEICSQPAVWSVTLAELKGQLAALRAFREATSCDAALFIGCGSTYYLALSAAAAFQELCGLPAFALPSSEVWLGLDQAVPAGRRTLLVAVSRSGETSETIRAVEAFKAAGRGPVVTLSCYPERPLAGLGTFNLVLPAAQEQSVAQTRAFSTLYLATLVLAAVWANQADPLAALAPLPAACQQILDTCGGLARQLAEDEGLRQCFYLGSGSRYGLACELSLKLKEMSLSVSEPFHVLEFRHGPQSMAGPDTLIIGLVSNTRRTHELAVLDEMRRLGAKVLTIGATPADVVIDAGSGEVFQGLLYLPFGQLLAYERAIRRGLDPDSPHNLTAVVRLDGPTQ